MSARRRTATRRAIALALVVCLSPAASVAGRAAEPDAPAPVPSRIPPDRVPLYFLALHFFDSGAHYRTELPQQYERRLFELGVEPGTRAAEALERATEAGTAILAERSIDPELLESEREFLDFQEAAIERKSRRLARVYGGLLADLEGAGLDPDRLREYLDRAIRPKVSLWVEVPPGGDPAEELLDDPNLRAVLEFEEIAEASYRDGATNLPAKGE